MISEKGFFFIMILALIKYILLPILLIWGGISLLIFLFIKGMRSSKKKNDFSQKKEEPLEVEKMSQQQALQKLEELYKKEQEEKNRR